MINVISSGFAILGKDGRILLGCTKKYNKENCWTVFKGQTEVGETLIETAIRELDEEAGINVMNDDRLNKNISTSPFFEFDIHDKRVVIYLLQDAEGVLENYEFKCRSFWSSENPEICEFQWFTLEEAKKCIFPSQRGLIDEIIKRIRH